MNGIHARNVEIGMQQILLTLDGVTAVHPHWGAVEIDSDCWTVVTQDDEGFSTILATNLSREDAIRQHRALGLKDCWLYSS